MGKPVNRHQRRRQAALARSSSPVASSERKGAPIFGEIAKMPQANSALERQRVAFVEKFGRQPLPSDPVFFEPDADEPVAMSEDKIRQFVADAMRAGGAREHIVRAFEATGHIVTADTAKSVPPHQLAQWQRAIKQAVADLRAEFGTYDPETGAKGPRQEAP